MKIGAGSKAMAAVLSLVAAPCLAADRFEISARLVHAGTEFGEPRMLVSDGQQASVETLGEGAYSLVVTPSTLPDGQVKVVSSVRSQYGAMTPTVTTELGQRSTISIGELELQLVVTRAGS